MHLSVLLLVLLASISSFASQAVTGRMNCQGVQVDPIPGNSVPEKINFSVSGNLWNSLLHVTTSRGRVVKNVWGSALTHSQGLISAIYDEGDTVLEVKLSKTDRDLLKGLMIYEEDFSYHIQCRFR